MKKRGSEQTWWIIVMGIIAIIALVILLFIFRGTINKIWDDVNKLVKGTSEEVDNIDVSDIVSGSGSVGGDKKDSSDGSSSGESSPGW